MEATIIEAVKGQGAWAVLFAVLLIWVLRENAKREARYQSIIEALTEKFETIENGICEIKNEIKEKFTGRG